MNALTMTKNVSLSTTPSGTPRPQLEIRVDDQRERGLGRRGGRELLAQLFEHAAKAVRATAAEESWTIEILRWSDARGAVTVELITGSDTEIDAAMALLRSVAE